ncbi:alpha/beta fold hydrolase [Benzoatithermus flavus]|uniref:Alpha/beta hydrolase n=1 Tax=Benzoatithermus flavus TaxID=3108223 RepID=A0ABU8XN02_9PROT
MSGKVQRERGRIKAAGRELAYERLRPEEATGGLPIVFLHEGLGSISLWRDFPQALCRRAGREGIVYDRWGHGGSEPLDRPRSFRYLHDEARIFLPAVLDALGVERAVAFGHSDGGTIALLFAAHCQKRAAAIVTEAAHVFVEDVTLEGIRAAVRAYETTDFRRRLARHHGEKTDAVFRAWHETWLSPAFRDWNIEAELPLITCPALILQGEDDEYGTPAQVDAIVRGVRGPVESTLLPGCTHVPHQQARDVVLELAAGFIARRIGQTMSGIDRAADSL